MHSDLPQFFGLPSAVSGAKAAILEASATAATTTTSTTDIVMTGMTLTPGAGDYLVVFSTSVRNGTADTTIFASIYVGGVQQAHTERRHFQEDSIAGDDQPLMTYAHVSVGAGQAVEIWWRTSAGTATARARTLNLFPVAAADVSQATATANTTLNSGTYTQLGSMTLSPAAGTYLALFSTSASGPSGSIIDTSLFVGGVQVAHTERSNTQETSIPATAFAHAILAKVAPTAGQVVEVRWRNSGTAGTITAHQRTLTLYKVDPADIFEATATADTTSTATTDALLGSMTLTPGAGDYLALFSSSFFYVDVTGSPVTFYSLYVNGVKVAHTERQPIHESSLTSTNIPVATNGVVSPGASQVVEVQWRSDLTNTRTARERTLVLLREPVTPPTPGRFNAYETATAAGAITGYIKTKIAGTTINLHMIAVNAAKTAIDTTFTGTVKVEVLNASNNSGALDANACRSTWTVIQTLSPDPAFIAGDLGRKAISFTQANSYPNVRLRISYPTTSPTLIGCSTDNFAIRPNTFTSYSVTDATWTTAGTTRTLNNTTVPGGTVHKAGQPFTVRATAVNGAGSPATTTNYTGAPTPTLTDCGASSACPSTPGTVTLGSSFVAGVLTANTASYSEVGSFSMQLVDSSFASVDASDGSTTTERNITSSVISVGRFVPDNFAVALNTPSFGTTCGSFTYVGEKFNYATVPVITVTARNFAGSTTTLYTGALWQITSASLTGKSYTWATGTLDISGITGTDPGIDSTTPGAGVGTLTFRTPSFFLAGTGFFFSRTTPVAPFDAEISLAINVIDADAVSYASNPARFGQATAGNGIAFSSGKSMRFGRLVIRNANGTQLLPLPVRVEAQYWSGAPTNAFITNTLDNCTSIASANDAMANYTGNLSGSPTCETAISGGGALSMGRRTLLLAAPGSGNNGSVNLTVNLGAAASGSTCTTQGGAPGSATTANLPHLQGNWTGVNYDQNPTARATFGVSRGADEVIFVRENF